MGAVASNTASPLLLPHLPQPLVAWGGGGGKEAGQALFPLTMQLGQGQAIPTPHSSWAAGSWPGYAPFYPQGQIEARPQPLSLAWSYQAQAMALPAPHGHI